MATIPLKPCKCWIALDNKKWLTKFNLTKKDFGKFDYLEEIKFSDGKTEYTVHQKNNGLPLKEAVKLLIQQHPKKKVIIHFPPMYIEAVVKSTWIRKPTRYTTSFDTKKAYNSNSVAIKSLKSESDWAFELLLCFGEHFSVYTCEDPITDDDGDCISSDTNFEWKDEMVSRNFLFEVIKTNSDVSTVIFHPKFYFTTFHKIWHPEHEEKYGHYYFGFAT